MSRQIIGIIDNQGNVKSIECEMREEETHSKLFPNENKRWRYDKYFYLQESALSEPIDYYEWQAIRHHLYEIYKIEV